MQITQGSDRRELASLDRAEQLFRAHQEAVYRRRDRDFAWLMAAQWIAGLVLAFTYSPYGWSGKVHHTHLHVYYALFVGGAISLPAIALALLRPGWFVTRHVVAVAQMLWSALFIHLSGGRIETHFHVFGSLAFLAFYRDWKLIVTATTTVAAEHLVRGLTWPESIYGIANPEWWRILEHAFWVIFENTVLVMGIQENLREMRTLAARQTAMEGANASIEQKVEERTRELEASHEQYRSLLESTRTVPWKWDVGREQFTYVGPQGGLLLGCSAKDWLEPGFWRERVHPDDRAAVMGRWNDLRDQAVELEFEYRMKRNDGAWVWVRSIVSADRNSPGSVQGFMLDVTEQRRIEFELQQAQKLESVGRLAAGVAHEINTPIQFVSDSIHFVRDATLDLFGLVKKLRAVSHSVVEGAPAAEAAAAVATAEEEADLAYLLDNVPKALDRSLDGLDRVTTIVRSMKEFAHPDQKEMTAVDLNRAIASTLTIARNEYKYIADVVTDFGELPAVICHGGDVNQAILNIVVNAAHAIGDVVEGTADRGRISVRTRSKAGTVVVEIEDTGGGIAEGIRAKIFDPFFTTKEVGKGTGQGLAIARSVVVEKHGGELYFETEMGVGTTFFIELPVDGRGRKAAAAA